MGKQGPDGRDGRLRKGLVRSVAAGMVVGLLTLAVGATLVLARPTQWTGRTTLLVAPTAGSDEATTASLYELLTQGQVAATFAALLRNPGFEASLLEKTGLRATDEQVSLTAEVVPDTFLITLTATAPTRAEALVLVRASAATAPSFVDVLSRPFSLRAVDIQAIDATRSSNLTLTVVGLVVVCALVLAVLVQQLIYQLFSVRTRRAAPGGEQVAGHPAARAEVKPQPGQRRPGPGAAGSKARPSRSQARRKSRPR